ncbi:unnamed protein product [Vitrella brassicaformis CCMP3155]|uniref:Uncharacterized protein n=2 Tax=Vitrella brassicaformis TaxID=1169539 RepID=A0A0G4GQW5_VITBC|nr:unnamed protein product [Vitrella brassicaformis CCMP3155]|eukprot:CEM32695.1 unnamed protein product [Vitrella brassicaformis CCMP3155]
MDTTQTPCPLLDLSQLCLGTVHGYTSLLPLAEHAQVPPNRQQRKQQDVRKPTKVPLGPFFEAVDLSTNRLTSAPSLSDPLFRELYCLDLSFNFLSQASLESLRGARVLLFLDLSHNPLSIDALEALEDVIVLDLVLPKQLVAGEARRRRLMETLPKVWVINGMFLFEKDRRLAKERRERREHRERQQAQDELDHAVTEQPQLQLTVAPAEQEQQQEHEQAEPAHSQLEPPSEPSLHCEEEFYTSPPPPTLSSTFCLTELDSLRKSLEKEQASHRPLASARSLLPAPLGQRPSSAASLGAASSGGIRSPVPERDTETPVDVMPGVSVVQLLQPQHHAQQQQQQQKGADRRTERRRPPAARDTETLSVAGVSAFSMANQVDVYQPARVRSPPSYALVPVDREWLLPRHPVDVDASTPSRYAVEFWGRKMHLMEDDGDRLRCLVEMWNRRHAIAAVRNERRRQAATTTTTIAEETTRVPIEQLLALPLSQRILLALTLLAFLHRWLSDDLLFHTLHLILAPHWRTAPLIDDLTSCLARSPDYLLVGVMVILYDSFDCPDDEYGDGGDLLLPVERFVGEFIYGGGGRKSRAHDRREADLFVAGMRRVESCMDEKNPNLSFSSASEEERIVVGRLFAMIRSCLSPAHLLPFLDSYQSQSQRVDDGPPSPSPSPSQPSIPSILANFSQLPPSLPQSLMPSARAAASCVVALLLETGLLQCCTDLSPFPPSLSRLLCTVSGEDLCADRGGPLRCLQSAWSAFRARMFQRRASANSGGGGSDGSNSTGVKACPCVGDGLLLLLMDRRHLRRDEMASSLTTHITSVKKAVNISSYELTVASPLPSGRRELHSLMWDERRMAWQACLVLSSSMLPPSPFKHGRDLAYQLSLHKGRANRQGPLSCCLCSEHTALACLLKEDASAETQGSSSSPPPADEPRQQQHQRGMVISASHPPSFQWRLLKQDSDTRKPIDLRPFERAWLRSQKGTTASVCTRPPPAGDSPLACKSVTTAHLVHRSVNASRALLALLDERALGEALEDRLRTNGSGNGDHVSAAAVPRLEIPKAAAPTPPAVAAGSDGDTGGVSLKKALGKHPGKRDKGKMVKTPVLTPQLPEGSSFPPHALPRSESQFSLRKGQDRIAAFTEKYGRTARGTPVRKPPSLPPSPVSSRPSPLMGTIMSITAAVSDSVVLESSSLEQHPPSLTSTPFPLIHAAAAHVTAPCARPVSHHSVGASVRSTPVMRSPVMQKATATHTMAKRVKQPKQPQQPQRPQPGAAVSRLKCAKVGLIPFKNDYQRFSAHKFPDRARDRDRDRDRERDKGAMALASGGGDAFRLDEEGAAPPLPETSKAAEGKMPESRVSLVERSQELAMQKWRRPIRVDQYVRQLYRLV